jgi:catecholate siderophore receptor
MRRIALLSSGIGCILASALVAAPPAHARSIATPPAQVASDTTNRIRFQIAPRPLTQALRDFSRQAGIRVEVDIPAAATLSAQAVSGVLTAPEALRQLLAGTGMVARFVDAETAHVTRAGSGDIVVHALTPITVIGTRSRGYATPRTRSATRTDTPLRDTPQSVSVVTSELIADQAMQNMADVTRYLPGITMGQGEGHRDAPTIRGNSSTADFFVDGVRDDAQYLRDVYNVERVEALKGPNAMIFGRGGAGGVLNRVSKGAQWTPTRTLTVEAGSFDHKRATLDVGQGLGAPLAARFNGMYERSDGFRDEFGLRRYGLNPTLAFAVGARTTVLAGYEYFNDERTVDRGIPSFEGRPSNADLSTFFGNPDLSNATLELHAATATLEHAAGPLTIRNRLHFADYDKFYQNSFPGAVNDAGTEVTLTAYNQTLLRRNVFNQTDLIGAVTTGALRHTLLFGAEMGRQKTDNIRNTGYYNDTATSFSAPFDQPTVATPITFRQSDTDADNRTTVSVAGVYLQDQLTLSPRWQATIGVRYDRFDLDFRNNRNDQTLVRDDDLISPRAGLVFKPTALVSLYGSYTMSYLPSSGDQFASLTATSQTLEPEQFRNYEVGAKWDVRPNLALTTALYRLDRTNTAAPDPNDATRTVQTGEQRTTGFELGGWGSVTDAWQIVAGFTWQEAEITSTTAAAPEGATVPLVPKRTFSLWNRYQVHRSVGVGIGVVHQSDMYAAIDNTVTLPGFTRADGALFVRVHPLMSVQVNVENLFDERYFATSHGNNNIMPGASRTLRVSLTTRR